MTGTLRGLRSVHEFRQAPPGAEKLSYSIGLPGGAHCAGSARGALRSLLDRHGLADLCDTAALAASELVACAYRFTPDKEMVLKVRWQFDALRIVVFDQHPAHSSPEASEECRRRRSRGMWLLASVVESCGGDWGLTPVLTPMGGTKSWALVPMPR
ncbi:ATP-binding protein [Streptomyces sp. AP-93]|uniref:ATP-binding protein n=1 Tax=Streptomyces sp. AP-93 TaxID=2929048 RepID=UPI001FAF62C7|nr:ATP-binding protein [Streptomyces sp. AP-93]MCJ0873162.1 ATP-binding protein [Streptomyces sp. AP-93]